MKIKEIAFAIAWILVPITAAAGITACIIYINTTSKNKVRAIIDSGCSKTTYAVISDSRLVQVYDCKEYMETKESR